MTEKPDGGAASGWRGIVAGWVGAFAGNALLGFAFTSPWVTAWLLDPALQSAAFLELARTRNVSLSVAGLVVLGAIPGWAYVRLRAAVPGGTAWKRGLWWGLLLWALYWLPQEWFIYVTLLREPLPLAALELMILLAGCLLQGAIIAIIVELRPSPTQS